MEAEPEAARAVGALGVLAKGALTALDQVRNEGLECEGLAARLRALQTQLEADWETIIATASALDNEAQGTDEADALRSEQTELTATIHAQRAVLKEQVDLLRQLLFEMHLINSSTADASSSVEASPADDSGG